MRRQKKFYAWGYADEDLTPDEIAAVGGRDRPALRLVRLRRHAAAQGRGDHAARAARRRAGGAAIDRAHRSSDAARAQLRQGGLRHLRMFMRSVPNPPDAVAFPENEQDIVRVLDWCD